nr:immunoglobulin light chain junction region [Macaca mulatta]
CSAYVDSNVLF